MKTASEMDVLRSKIDDIDEQILLLLAFRLEVAEEIGVIKKETWLKSLDSTRFTQVLQQVAKLWKEHGISEKCTDAIWQAIHEESLSRQK